MSESLDKSFFNLFYPNGNDITGAMSPLPQSPINYNMAEDKVQMHTMRENYDESYLLGPVAEIANTTMPMASDSNALHEVDELAIYEEGVGRHPGPPWFRWNMGSGHLGYRAID